MLFPYSISTRNVFQLRETFECYKQNYGTSIQEDIKSCGDGNLESLLTLVITCIDTPEKHFAQVINGAVVGLGTDEDYLNRAIVSRAEIDMIKIKEEYSTLFKNSLEDDVKDDISGDYKDFLLTLLGAGF